MTPADISTIGAVIIGRNEGERLVACLASLRTASSRVVYVDSGSTDDSVGAARMAGAQVVVLDTDIPFTAARARNAGFKCLLQEVPALAFVQFIDGDCEMQPDWLGAAHEFMIATPEAAVVCGRLRERYPDMTVYNRIADTDWKIPVGQIRACGGIAMMRTKAFSDSGGFNPDLIAGEEPELCVRLRKSGWEIWCIDAEMAFHDIGMTHFTQWWKRCRRTGYTYAEGKAMHGAHPERHNVDQTRRALVWGLGLPMATVLGVIQSPWALLMLLIWPAQVMRLAIRGEGWTRAFFLMLGKIPEALGVLEYHWKQIRGQQAGLIEYK